MSNLSNPQPNQQFNPPQFDSLYKNDEIDLRELFCALWSGKLWIICITLVFSIGAFIFAYVQPNIYKVSSTLRIDWDIYLEQPNWSFKGQKVEVARDLLPYLSSVSTKEMVAKSVEKPIEVLDAIIISTDKQGNILISKESTSAENAFNSVRLYTDQINSVFKANELQKVLIALKASASLADLKQGKISDSLADKYANLLFKQAILMSPDSKLVEIMGKPVLPTTHIKPKRALIVVLGTLLGGMLGVAIVLIRFAFRRDDNITE